VKLALALDTRPTAKELVVIAERWRPYRAVAARLLWAFNHRMKEQIRQKAETGLTAETKQGLPRKPARK
jgi:3-methyladenine DNA glycosylase/8-oxoguanine DNA glycosylase